MLSAVLLAAGASRRMGAENKLLLPVPASSGEPRPMVRHALEVWLAAPVFEVVVVLGHEAERVAAVLPEDARVRLVVNPDHATGQMSSVRAGLAAVGREASGVFVGLADQVALTSADIAAIARAFEARARGAILVPIHRGERGNPIVLDRAGVDAILARGVRFGCRQLIADHPDLVETFEMETDRILLDVDRPADYEALVRPVRRP